MSLRYPCVLCGLTQQFSLQTGAHLSAHTQSLLQGNPRIVKHLQTTLSRHARSHITVLLSEARPTAEEPVEAAACLAAPAAEVQYHLAVAFDAFIALQVLPSKLAMFRGIDAWVQVLIRMYFKHAQAAPM